MSTCTTLKTLQIAFTPPSPAPAAGYIVKWRKVGDLLFNTVSPNPIGSPVNIPNVEACGNIEGTIQTNCGGGNSGLVATFYVAGLGYPNPYTLVRTSSCIVGLGTSTYTLTGNAGDDVILKVKGSGAVAWNTISGTNAGISVAISGASTSASDVSGTTTSTLLAAYSAEALLSFTMPSSTVTLTSTIMLHNGSTSSIMTGSVELVSVNGNPSTVSTGACTGNSGGAW